MMTAWSDYRAAFDQLLARARYSLSIFDDDLERLGLNELARMEALRVFLTGDPGATIRIALKQTGALRSNQPRLLELLKSNSAALQIQQVHRNLHILRDTLVVADGAHALVRFDFGQPRAKLILDDKEEIIPYQKRFDAIWKDGGRPFTATTAGLSGR
ncbi:MAG: hypothetical protein LBO00_04400 [Zoogloeaceae bacterium]|nr:hypothetical protein [Zoogloeaceae bacterium]